MQPLVSLLADSLTWFEQSDPRVTFSYSVYPGQSKCKYEQPHSIWHEMSANGLLDIIYLANFGHFVLS